MVVYGCEEGPIHCAEVALGRGHIIETIVMIPGSCVVLIWCPVNFHRQATKFLSANYIYFCSSYGSTLLSSLSDGGVGYECPSYGGARQETRGAA